MTDSPAPATAGVRRVKPARAWPRVALAALLGMLLIVSVFDWTWFRPLIRHYVLAHAGRALDFEHLHVGLAPDLAPRIELRGLRIENAAWAAPRPLIEAGLVRADVAWRSLTGPHLIVTRLVLVDASVDLERSADGLRNWRLSRPLDRGPGRVRVLSLDATRSDVRIADAGRSLEVAFRIEPLAPAQLTAPEPVQAPAAFAKRVTFAGSHRGQPFTGDAAVGSIVGFADTGLPFALRGELRSGLARLQFDGTATDVQQLAALDLELRFASPKHDTLRALLPAAGWPALPLAARAHLRQSGTHWDFDAISATLGRTDLAGRVAIDTAGADRPRSRLQATLRSTALHADELAAAAARPAVPAPNDRAPLAAEPATATAWQALDAAVDWQVERVVHAAVPQLQSLRVVAALDDGRLLLKPLVLGAAQGRLEMTVSVDSTAQPMAVTASAELAGLQLDRWTDALHGTLHGHAALTARADSLPALARAVSGTLTFALRDGSLSNQLDAKLALDAGAVLRAQFGSDRRVPMRCARLALQIGGGRATTRGFVAETERAVLVGTGSLDFATRSIALRITPQRKTMALFGLDRSLQVSGAVARPRVALAEAREPASTLRCAEPG